MIFMFACDFVAHVFLIMHLLLLSFTAFLSTMAIPAADDADDWIFPTEAQIFGSDFLWNDPDVDLGFATGDLGFELSGDNNPELFDEGSSDEYLAIDDDFMSAMIDDQQPIFEFESVCSMNQGSAEWKVRRENQCPSM